MANKEETKCAKAAPEAAKITSEKKQEAVKAALAKAAPIKTKAKPAAPAEPDPAIEQEKAAPKDVHELSWVEGKGWSVKRQGSSKVIKYFPTKLEATQYLLQVSENQSTRVVIRLKNGKFQKFENATRALSYAKTSKEDD